jgi:trehalose-6-phosphatase
MRRIITFISLLASAAMLQGCSGEKGSKAGAAGESNAVTQTRMDNIDSLQGTISDEMIITDDATDEAALETADSAATDTGKPGPADTAAKTAADATGQGTGD